MNRRDVIGGYLASLGLVAAESEIKPMPTQECPTNHLYVVRLKEGIPEQEVHKLHESFKAMNLKDAKLMVIPPHVDFQGLMPGKYGIRYAVDGHEISATFQTLEEMKDFTNKVLEWKW